MVGMDAQPDPTPEQEGARAHRETHETQQMQVRRSPRYGVFMAIGALLAMLAAWWISTAMPPAVNQAEQPVDTTPVIGLMLVVGFVVGGALGALVAVLIDRALSKRLHTVTAEHVDVAERPSPSGPEDAGDATFEPLGPAGDRRDELGDGDRPGDARPGDDRPREA